MAMMDRLEQILTILFASFCRIYFWECLLFQKRKGDIYFILLKNFILFRMFGINNSIFLQPLPQYSSFKTDSYFCAIIYIIDNFSWCSQIQILAGTFYPLHFPYRILVLPHKSSNFWEILAPKQLSTAGVEQARVINYLFWIFEARLGKNIGGAMAPLAPPLPPSLPCDL